jgi:Fe-S cluster biogenesis protein NfuA
MQPERDLRAAAERIESLLGEVSALGDSAARAKAEELVRLLMSLYGAGLDRIMEIIAGDGWEGGDGGDGGAGGGAADRLFDRLADDSLVSSLLVLHGLHPVALETRILRALDGVRPYLGSHGGDVKLLGVEDGVVRLRLEGACKGCPSSAITMKLAVEHAIEKAAPEVTGIEVEGLPGDAAPAAPAPGGEPTGLLQIGQTPLSCPAAIQPTP